MPVTIRSAVADDVPAILEIERQAGSAAHWAREQYDRRAAAGIVLVAEEKKDIAGFLCARAVASEWELENIVVAEAARRTGVGDRLLQEFQRLAREQAAASLWLEVRESNLPARRLYEKHGFNETGRRRVYYRNPDEDAIVYAFVPTADSTT